MATATIDTRFALNPLSGKGEGEIKKSELEDRIETEEGNISVGIGLLKKILKELPSGGSIEPYIENTTKLIYKKEDINKIFIEMIREKLIREERFGYPGAEFLSWLIQNSYDNGENNFVLETGETTPNYLCVRLKGQKNNPIRIHIEGSAGYYLGLETEYAEFIVLNDVRSNTGEKSKHSKYIILGDADTGLGDSSEHCRFYVHGKTLSGFASDAQNSTFILNKLYNMIDGDILPLHTTHLTPSENNIFITTNKETYKKFRLLGMDPPKYNVILKKD